MQDVKLLLDHLSRSQETTIKLILDCLYDVGAVNLINQRVRRQPFNRFGKSVATLSKPAFRIIAYYWFRKNCPQLITNWLHRKVSFGVRPTTLERLDAETLEILMSELSPSETSSPQAVSPQSVEVQTPPPQIAASQEVKRLRAQVKLLTGMLIGAIALFGGTAVWLFYSAETGVFPREAEHQTTAELCDPVDYRECSL